jgi:hypothetical protein
MELIAVDVAGIALGATLLAMCTIAVLALFVHERLLQRRMQQARAELPAQRRQAAVVGSESATNRRPGTGPRGVTLRERMLRTRRARAAANTTSERRGSRRSPERAAS